ncbi:MAG TPA: hypothetical protein VJM12_21040 [Pyrinomonadaceae bacterium]|nr:hypothetical protein [Pyrinomonadaceae bacterium]
MNLAKAAEHYVETLEHSLQRVRYSLRRQGFSQWSEQQILSKYIDELLPPNYSKTVVDIGAGNGIRWSNTYSLFLSGWRGVGIEADSRKFARLERAYRKLPQARACHETADPDNIVPLLKSLGIEKNFSVLSIDIDGNDYWVLKAILCEFQPALVVTEINEKIPPPLRFLFKYAPNSQLRHHFFGYSIAVLEDLCDQFDYGILQLEYNNAFIAPRELKDARFVDAETAYADGYRNRPDRKERFAANLDMEILHSLSAERGIQFLNDFYANERGKYFLAADREGLSKQLEVSGLTYCVAPV